MRMYCGAGFSPRGTLVPMSAWRTEVRRRLKACPTLVVLALGAALLSAQQQPYVAPDPARALEARYDLYPWWDANRGTPLPPSKDFGDPTG